MKMLTFITLAALLSVSSCSHFHKKSCCAKDKDKQCKDGSCPKEKKKDCSGESCEKKKQ